MRTEQHITVLVKKDNCGRGFKVQPIGPQNKEKASDKASDLTIRQRPGSRVHPGRETKWTPAVRTIGGAQEECVSLAAFPHTHTHTSESHSYSGVSWFICTDYFKCGNLDKWQQVQRGRLWALQLESCLFVLCCLFYFLHLMSQFLSKQRDKASPFQGSKKTHQTSWHVAIWAIDQASSGSPSKAVWLLLRCNKTFSYATRSMDVPFVINECMNWLDWLRDF